MNIYIDALNGSDLTGDGTMTNPYQTLQYFLMTVALKSGTDYTVYLEEGTYEITNAEAFGRFSNSSITIIGKQKDTVILQKVGFYINSAGGGSNTFKLTMRKLIYDILPTLTSHNLNCFRWQWHFENVVFRTIPNNSYALFLPYAPMVIRNSVKYSSSTCFLRTTDATIKVYDSIGPFTSGYATAQSHWDASGNSIKSFSFDEEYRAIEDDSLGVFSGEYHWSLWLFRTFILNNGEYKKWNQDQVPHWSAYALGSISTEGMEEIAFAARKRVADKRSGMNESTNSYLAEGDVGKLFSQSVDLKKNDELISIGTEVI